MFKEGDVVRLKKFPGIWGKVMGMLDNSFHYILKTNIRPTLYAEEDEIELAPLEALADA